MCGVCVIHFLSIYVCVSGLFALHLNIHLWATRGSKVNALSLAEALHIYRSTSESYSHEKVLERTKRQRTITTTIMMMMVMII